MSSKKDGNSEETRSSRASSNVEASKDAKTDETNVANAKENKKLEESASESRGPVRRSRKEVDAILQRIAEMMVNGHWKRGASDASIAKEYGVSTSMARQWAIMASRLVTSPLDADALHEMRVATVSSLERIARNAEVIALRGARQGGDPSQLRTAVMALDKAAEVAGVKHSRATTEVNVFAGGELPAEMQDRILTEGRKLAMLIDSQGEQALRDIGGGELVAAWRTRLGEMRGAPKQLERGGDG